jgi:hypothetical protein
MTPEEYFKKAHPAKYADIETYSADDVKKAFGRGQASQLKFEYETGSEFLRNIAHEMTDAEIKTFVSAWKVARQMK